MSPKTAKAAKKEMAAPKSASKTEKKSAPAKGGKASEAKALEAAPVAEGVDQEELEEQQEEAAAVSGGGNAAALAAAAAGSPTESASFKNFRHHPDMENFYRFIFENDLRHEALAIIDEMAVQKLNRKMVKSARAQAH